MDCLLRVRNKISENQMPFPFPEARSSPHISFFHHASLPGPAPRNTKTSRERKSFPLTDQHFGFRCSVLSFRTDRFRCFGFSCASDYHTPGQSFSSGKRSASRDLFCPRERSWARWGTTAKVFAVLLFLFLPAQMGPRQRRGPWTFQLFFFWGSL